MNAWRQNNREKELCKGQSRKDFSDDRCLGRCTADVSYTAFFVATREHLLETPLEALLPDTFVPMSVRTFVQSMADPQFSLWDAFLISTKRTILLKSGK